MRVLRTFAKLQFAIAGKVKTQSIAFYGTYPEEDLILSEGSHTFSLRAVIKGMFTFTSYIKVTYRCTYLGLWFNIAHIHVLARYSCDLEL